jgi:hypothetical protein
VQQRFSSTAGAQDRHSQSEGVDGEAVGDKAGLRRRRREPALDELLACVQRPNRMESPEDHVQETKRTKQGRLTSALHLEKPDAATLDC